MGENDSDEFCYSILSKYPVADTIPGLNGTIGVVALLVGLLYLFNSALTIYWIRHQKFHAELGIERAARHVVFPVYVPFMWASALSDICVALSVMLVPIDMYDSNDWTASTIVSMAWTVQHVVTEGVAFLLMQYGCGLEAAKRASFYASIWGIFTFLCQLYFQKAGDSNGAVALLLTWNVILVVAYGVLWLTPEEQLFRRDALIGYSRFWFLFRLISLVSSSLLVADISKAVGECFYFFGPILIYILCKPYVVYWALLSDSVWWQGVYLHSPSTRRLMGSSKGEMMRNRENLVSPLYGIEVGFDDAQELGRQVDVLRTEGRVKLLNFAYLSLDKKSMLGCGSYSKVYKGRYRGTPVAIKLLFTNDLNPDVIKRCSTEAQLLSEISHPNVVEIFGVSVLPPSVCIVLEICHYGSLSDVIRGSVGGGVVRRPLPLTHADKMFLALGCGKGLEALHNYSQSLCHRDVKSFNFLVDGQLNAKIADLELGGVEPDPLDSPAPGGRTSSITSGTSNMSNEGGNRSSFRSSSTKRRRGKAKDNFLSTWLPPEVMLGSPHTQASDVYSLGLVLWEILSGSIPYQNFTRQDDIKNHVLDGFRPPIPASFPEPRYTSLITRCWDADPSARPAMSEVVIALRICWEGSLHRHLFSTPHLVDLPVIQEAYDMECERQDYVTSMNQSFSYYRGSASSVSGIASPSRAPPSARSKGALANRLPPSEAVIKALAPLQQEKKLLTLDTLCGATHVLVSSESPYIVLWAGNKWPQITGYFLSDVLCGDLSFLSGPRTDKYLLALIYTYVTICFFLQLHIDVYAIYSMK